MIDFHTSSRDFLQCLIPFSSDLVCFYAALPWFSKVRIGVFDVFEPFWPAVDLLELCTGEVQLGPGNPDGSVGLG